jgi:hypothetical protein
MQISAVQGDKPGGSGLGGKLDCRAYSHRNQWQDRLPQALLRFRALHFN